MAELSDRPKFVAAHGMQRPRPKVLAVGGPTATGKTRLSVCLAQRFGGEIISVDSMQIYRGLNIGTAKATEEEQQGVVHHLLDIADPRQQFSLAEFLALAETAAEEILAGGKLPVLTGGTGLYLSAFLSGLSLSPQKGDPAVRAKLEARLAAGESEQLFAELRQIDPAYAETLHPNNHVRVLRALELFLTTGKTMTQQRKDSHPAQPPYQSLLLCLTCRDRQELYRRIDARVDAMMEAGILREAEVVWQNRTAFYTAAQAIGYKEFFPYFEGQMALEPCVELVKQRSRNYAKRQLTWFRNQTQAVWLYVDEPGLETRAEALAERFLQDSSTEDDR